jgi:predicted acylesterase/phospholipase RssA
MQLMLLLALLITACSYPTRNQQATVISEKTGYRWHSSQPSGLEDTLVIVTASGGGTRATALTLSVLQAMNEIKLASGSSLAQEVDLISSVSGGSVAAGYFALEGTQGFKSLEDNFIRKNGTATLLFNALNPIGLARLTLSGEERIDVLIDYLDEKLFHEATYQTLMDKKRRPFLILNAADMVEGVPFSFTQRKLDLLCSNLLSLPLATAVAASAAVPVAFSPVTLTNYSPCAASKNKAWPPAWVKASLDQPDVKQSIWYDNPMRATMARAENAYALGKPKKAYVHLLDGGIADNLGIFEPFRMITTGDTQPSFLTYIDKHQITKLIFITINARSFAPSKLDQQKATPGIIDMLKASIYAPIDRTSAGTTVQLRNILLDQFPKMPGNQIQQKTYKELADHTALISIDFDAIVNAECRRKFQSIETNWSLDKEQIDAVLMIGGALLQNNPDFPKLLSLLGDPPRPRLPTVEQVCQLL